MGTNSLAPELLIFGAGEHARRVAKALGARGHHVEAFISSSPSVHQLDGIPVVSWSELEGRAFQASSLICAIFNRNDPYDQLVGIAQAHGFVDPVMPWQYDPWLKRELGWCYWLDGNSKPFEEREEDQDYIAALSLLGDDESRETFRRIHAFRSGEDLSFSSYRCADHQYFNDLTLSGLKPDQPISYLDIGAYNGDTLKVLLQHQAVGRAWLFEPERTNYQALQKATLELIGQYPTLQAVALPLALGHSNAFIELVGEGEAASVHGESGSNSMQLIQAVRGDELLPQDKVDFIKVDAEGADLAAIEGLAKLIRRSKPIMAISIYHRPQDIVDIPLAVAQLLQDAGARYRFHIRQHMSNSFDSVLYAIPELST
ncbi:FkbM family methyltransferase [Cyanobium sp. Morenito 9A2]|uniref:FkbM family methyltransferase n=1 Tax=Cyanobium sp. Morenito 9A2 TaxID=2823718 RepID=UPI0020CEEBDE|nr:FkbM family methyltransferase [Cyanobium sp. Morenito 9A2]MCP9848779.1 FkbM family methyltransferase [Cyanobium sp. Morenito 9A2]